MSCPSASLAVWASHWLAGGAAPDDVVDALHLWAPLHFVTAGERVAGERLAGAPVAEEWFDESDGSVVHLLRMMRTVGGSFTVALPVPGDVRGIPAGGDLAAAALEAGEAVLIDSAAGAVGLVPAEAGDEALTWTVYPLASGLPHADAMPLGEAEYLLRQATRDAAAALATMQFTDLAGPREVRPLIVEALADLSMHRFPDAIPPRAARVLDTANEVDAILRVAGEHGALQSLSATGISHRDEVLRPLLDTVRQARVAAFTACVAPPRG
ncbi:hypothetical protein HT102_01775 [Hoyosella sp. G463]|uniref:Uncharacterized protein n=1 Tax=Lolliginicoccus lacisalsi TaxID=2742202 RepID=A0A927PKW2_9ACTN|nr:hypothetical protein [Lolliginicoccus lacisalsi]MBD8505219.1 hypothetical protein [Lolliginicoccus lacisalsi]